MLAGRTMLPWGKPRPTKWLPDTHAPASAACSCQLSCSAHWLLCLGLQDTCTSWVMLLPRAPCAHLPAGRLGLQHMRPTPRRSTPGPPQATCHTLPLIQGPHSVHPLLHLRCTGPPLQHLPGVITHTYKCLTMLHLGMDPPHTMHQPSASGRTKGRAAAANAARVTALL